jgi:hypothetical protein
MQERQRWVFSSDYLAVYVAGAAFCVSLYQPVVDYFAQPDLRLALSSFAQISTNVGSPILAPTVTIVNIGNGPGAFSEIRCALGDNKNPTKLIASTFNVIGGQGQTLPVSGQVLNPSEAFVNSVNCVSLDTVSSSVGNYTLLMDRVFEEAQRAGWPRCDFPRPFLSTELTADLEEFFDAHFVFQAGELPFSVEAVDFDGNVVANANYTMDITPQAIERLKRQRSGLALGERIYCPSSPNAPAEVFVKKGATQ